METNFQWYVGIDWATEAHQVCLIDTRGKIVQQRSVPHSGDGIAQFIDWLTAVSGGQPSAVGVAIEIPRGAMVETLVERGFGVFSLNPKQLDRFRDRFSVAGAKDDSRDAHVLADSLRTDQPCFHCVRLDDTLTIQIREWSRLHEDLREQANGLTNRLREQLHRYYPQMLRLSPAADEPWLWALWELAPLPAQAGPLKPERVAKLLRSHRIRRVNSTEVIATLKATPVFVAPGTAEAASSHIRLLLPQLRLVSQQQATVAKQIQSLLQQISARPPQPSAPGQRSEHSDVEVLLSVPGIGPFVSATMLAEASQALAERDYHALRCYGGLAPVTRQSGKKRVVVMRYACNLRLRNAFYHWARVSIQKDAHSRAHYAELRGKGHRHGRALRSVADRWIDVLIAMLKSGSLYDPQRRGGPAVLAGSAADAQP